MELINNGVLLSINLQNVIPWNCEPSPVLLILFKSENVNISSSCPLCQRLPVDSEVPQPAEMLPCCSPLLSGKQYYSSLKSPFMACYFINGNIMLVNCYLFTPEIVGVYIKK